MTSTENCDLFSTVYRNQNSTVNEKHRPKHWSSPESNPLYHRRRPISPKVSPVYEYHQLFHAAIRVGDEQSSNWAADQRRSRLSILSEIVTNAAAWPRSGSTSQLSQRVQTRRLLLWARVYISTDITRAFRVSTGRLPNDWRCRPGRPRHTWLRTLEADLQPLNHGLNSA